MTSEPTRKGDDDLTLWIGGVMVVIILVLGVLWVQQGRELGRLHVRCADLEAQNVALRKLAEMAGLVPGEPTGEQPIRPEHFDTGGEWRELDLVEDGIIIEHDSVDRTEP
jgi:hypothetical protein